MIAGFVPGSRGSLMMDVVVTSMLLVLPLMWASIQKAKVGRLSTHRCLQTLIAVMLLVVVVLFEIDVRTNDWRVQAQPSPYYDSWLFPVLWVHLFFALNTTWLWAYTTIAAWRHFARPLRPGHYSLRHRKFGKATALFTVATALTGWTFYWMGFLAA